MSLFRRLGALAATLALAACASLPTPYVPGAADGWTPIAARIRPVGLGLLPGAQLSPGVRFAGGIDVISPETTPLHGLSDLKILDGDLISVSDSGDLARARLRLDRHGRLTGLDQPRVRRLTLTDGSPITEKVDGDAEGLVITASGDLLISFERDHRIWRASAPGPTAGAQRGNPVASGTVHRPAATPWSRRPSHCWPIPTIGSPDWTGIRPATAGSWSSAGSRPRPTCGPGCGIWQATAASARF